MKLEMLEEAAKNQQIRAGD